MADSSTSTGDPDADAVLGYAPAKAQAAPVSSSTGDPDMDAVLGMKGTDEKEAGKTMSDGKRNPVADHKSSVDDYVHEVAS